jgi:thiamine pyrophosphate-dependent acetolactate synthase large subunit-like protein
MYFSMPRRTVSRAVTPALTARGVRHIFGNPGGKIFEIYDALADAVKVGEHRNCLRHLTTAMSNWLGVGRMS